MSKVTLTESQINEIINQQVKIYLAERNPNYGQDDQLLREGIVEDFFDIVERFELALLFIGFFPPFGDLADVVVAMKDFYKKDYLGGFLSLIAAIPGIGAAGTAAKIAFKSGKMTNVGTAFSLVSKSRGAVLRGLEKTDGELEKIALTLRRMAPELERKIVSSSPKGLLNFMISRTGYNNIGEMIQEASRMTGLVRWGYGRFARVFVPIFEVITGVARGFEEGTGVNIGVSDLYNGINEEIDKVISQGKEIDMDSIYKLIGSIPTSEKDLVKLVVGTPEGELTQATGFADLASKWGYSDPLQLAKDLGLKTKQDVVKYLQDGQSKGGFDKGDIQK